VRGLVAAGVAALAVVPAAAIAGAATTPPAPKKVKVADDYFGPAALKVHVGGSVVWRWPATNTNTHDVKLKKGPKGAKKFWSDPAAADFTFKRKLKVKGKYTIICTFHQDMVQTITVVK
jgi:plastocyanin